MPYDGACFLFKKDSFGIFWDLRFLKTCLILQSICVIFIDLGFFGFFVILEKWNTKNPTQIFQIEETLDPSVWNARKIFFWRKFVRKSVFVEILLLCLKVSDVVSGEVIKLVLWCIYRLLLPDFLCVNVGTVQKFRTS